MLLPQMRQMRRLPQPPGSSKKCLFVLHTFIATEYLFTTYQKIRESRNCRIAKARAELQGANSSFYERSKLFSQKKAWTSAFRISSLSAIPAVAGLFNNNNDDTELSGNEVHGENTMLRCVSFSLHFVSIDARAKASKSLFLVSPLPVLEKMCRRLDASARPKPCPR